MKRLSIFLVGLTLLQGVAWAGDYQGKVTLKSELAKRKIGVQKTTPPDDSPGYRGDVPPPSENELENIVVYITTPGLKATPAVSRSEQNTMVQKDKEFRPHVLPVVYGSKVYFENRDEFLHHIYSESKPGDFEREKVGKGGAVLPVLFAETSTVEVFCGIHPRMNSYVLVLPNNFYSRVDSQGRFRIRGLPAGKHQLCIFHPRLPKPIHKEIEVSGSGKTDNLEI